MSGPKTSVLSPNFLTYNSLSECERAAWAEKEILVSLKALADGEKKIETLILKIQALLGEHNPDSRIAEILEKAKRIANVDLDELDSEHQFSRAELSRIRGAATDVAWERRITLDTVKLEGKYLEFFQKTRDLSMEQKTGVARALASKSAEMNRQIRALEIVHWDLEEAIKQEMFNEGITTSFFIPFQSVRNRESAQETIDRINESLEKVSQMILSDVALEKLQDLKKKAKEIKDASFLSNFYQVVVRPFVKECEEYDAFYQAHYMEYEQYRIKYVALAEELGLEPQKRSFSESGLEFYKSKSDEFEKQILDARAMDFVMGAFDAAMQEMGYELVGQRDITRKSGKKYHNELFLYDSGTAVSVMHAPDGQVTMEIGGLDHEDRLPSEEETTHMVERMGTFCQDFDRLGEVLQKKGIDIKRVSMLPPDPQYATIINMDDFQIGVPIETIMDASAREEYFAAKKNAKHVGE